MEVIKELMFEMAQAGTLKGISIRPVKRGAVTAVEEIGVSVESGLIGDHYSGQSGKRQVTLIQDEHLDSVASFLNQDSIDPLLTRRNLVVSGVNLLSFKGHQFSIGEVILEMTGPCVPCTQMETNLGTGGYNAMRGHGGICARVVKEGTMRIGDKVSLLREKI